MVRLKDNCPFPSIRELPSFQFLSGAIKSITVLEFIELKKKFQFLSGAIKRQSREPMCAAVNEFQFLSGAIKSYRVRNSAPAFV